jgi:hypothetical protein
MASTPIVRSPLKPARKGEAPTLEWARWVESTLRRLIDQPLPRQRPITGGSEMLQFKVYEVRYDAAAEAWFCKVRPGYVRTISPDADATEPVKDWMPTVGDPAVALDADETPEIEIADGQTIYCRVATTTKGIIEAAPKIEAAATPEAGTHFQPPDADVEGDLYFPIADIEITGDPEVVTITQIQQGGPIVVVPNLPELKNVGEEREVFKGRESAGDTYDFRTLKQIEPDAYGLPIIKPEPEDPTEAGNLETIDFKFITQREEDAQVQVEDVGDGEGILVKGNGFDQNFEGIVKNLNVIDGLVTGYDEIAEGWWGGLDWYNGGGTEALRLTFEAGVLVGVIKGDSSGGGGYVENPVAGTEATPGFASILV